MNVAGLRAELEVDLEWRVSELRQLQNHGSVLADAEQDQFRRALILLLYAHFEGFAKFAFLLYITAVNRAGIRCGDATYAIAAASLADLFAALRNPQSKCAEFRSLAPEDADIHRFARDLEFIEKVDRFTVRIVSIPEHVVDVESNLKPVVLRKVLFRLGFPSDMFSSSEGHIHKLLNYRNKIAHGQTSAGVSRTEYDDLRDECLQMLQKLMAEITDALARQAYLRV